MRPDARDVEDLGRDGPSLVLPEAERSRARVAPQQARTVLVMERGDGEREQRMSDTTPHEVAAGRHAADLPGVRTFSRGAHARDAADELAAGREKRPVMARRGIAGAVEAGALDGQAGAELGVAEGQDLVQGCPAQVE